MGYRQTGSLVALGREEPFDEACRRTTRRVGELLRDRTAEHTPIAEPPAGAAAEWLAARKRAPGTLKRSWKVGEVTVTVTATGETYSIDVYTFDPVAPFVEYPTMPHLIMPRRPGGWLRWWDRSGRAVFARVVHHPGTQGSFMLATAIAEVAVMWQAIGREEMDRWARDQQAGV